jgi:two-component system, cell cycle sensor histidine kinase and response regulator CckA
MLNLCSNACHAIGEASGVIHVTCRQIDSSDTVFSAVPDMAHRAHAVIEVADTGCGMSEATIKRIFDPYFTTKEYGKGTGLGLPVTKAIILAHGGIIRVESTVGKGSTFRIYLPNVEPAVPVAQAPGSVKWELGGGESILRAEDSQVTGSMLVCALKEMKYRVTLAADGAEASEKFEKSPSGFDILVTEVILPRMGGLESLGIKAFLKKPFDLGQLSRVLKSCRR